MMRSRTYRLVVLEVDSALTAAGATPIETEVASTVVESETPWDAVRSWADRLSEEESS